MDRTVNIELNIISRKYGSYDPYMAQHSWKLLKIGKYKSRRKILKIQIAQNAFSMRRKPSIWRQIGVYPKSRKKAKQFLGGIESKWGIDPERNIWSLGEMVWGSGQMGELLVRRRRHLEIQVDIQARELYLKFFIWFWGRRRRGERYLRMETGVLHRTSLQILWA